MALAPREDAAERYRYSQEPASLMRRLIINIEIETADGAELVAHSNFILGELAVQAKHEMHRG